MLLLNKPIQKSKDIDLSQNEDFIVIPKESIKNIKTTFTHRKSLYENPIEEVTTIEYLKDDKSNFVVLPKTIAREFYTKTSEPIPVEIMSQYSKPEKNDYIVDIKKLTEYMKQFPHKGTDKVSFASFSVNIIKPDFDLKIYAPKQFVDSLDGREHNYEQKVKQAFDHQDQEIKTQIEEINRKLSKVLSGEITLSPEELKAENKVKTQLLEKLKEPLEKSAKVVKKTENGEYVVPLTFVGIYNDDKKQRDVYLLRDANLSPNVIKVPSVEFEDLKWSPKSQSDIKGAMIVKDQKPTSFDYMKRNSFREYTPYKSTRPIQGKVISEELDLA